MINASGKLRSTFTKNFVQAYVHGLIPPAWYVTNVLVMEHPSDEYGTAVTITVSAEGVGRGPIGAKVTLPAASDPNIDDLCARLGHELNRKARTAGPGVVRVALLENGKLPTRATEGATGYDLYASKVARLSPGSIVVVEVGIALEIPRGLDAQVRPRSSMSKRGLWVSLGTIDPDYRGVVGATIANLSRDDQSIAVGDRVAQLVIAPVAIGEFEIVEADAMSPTARGSGGFGSTGR